LGGKIQKIFNTEYGIVIPELRFAWSHEYDHASPQSSSEFVSGGGAFTTEGTRPGIDTATLGVGLTLAHNDYLTLSAKYNANIGDRYISHTGFLRARYDW
jgi:outer membrane autotransporter protein